VKRVQQHNIQQFLERFFDANHCSILEKEKGYVKVQLTVELDKQLTNRPFYWHYVEKIGAVGEPMQLTFITDPTLSINGEIIHFGSPRLHQMFATTKKLGRFIRLYEQVAEKSVSLHPWLNVNMHISYQCDRKQDRLLSLGIHLISGTIVEAFYDIVKEKQWDTKIPDYCFTISPLIKPASGFVRLEKYIEEQIANDDHSWANEAKKRWEEDLLLLDHFYETEEEKPEGYYTEKEALRQRYEPRIIVSIINGGLFYLQSK
jgi:hypothetical protein